MHYALELLLSSLGRAAQCGQSELDHHHADGWGARRQYMTRKMSGGGWRDSSRVTRLLAYRTLRKRDVPLAAAHTRVARTEPG